MSGSIAKERLAALAINQGRNHDNEPTLESNHKVLIKQVLSYSCVPVWSGSIRGGTERTGSRRSHKETVRRSLKGIKRGQRKPLDPSDEFKSLHTQAIGAFVDADFEAAEQLTLQAILVNPEMYAAHSLLAEIHLARRDRDKALTALFNGAHTRPRNTQVWTDLAELLLDRTQRGEDAPITDALYCYSRVIQIEPQNIRARCQRAELNRRLGYNGRAAAEYESLLKIIPHDLTILRSLAEIYTDLEDPQRAMEHYNASIVFYKSKEPDRADTFAWSDVNIYIELFADQQRYNEGIRALKYLSRWLLGRPDDPIWEVFDQDDREFDLDHYPRRVEVEGFYADSHEDMSYGQVGEAMKHFDLLEPRDSSPGATLYDYPDLFREVAIALRDTGHYDKALVYYQPLLQVSAFVNASDYAAMAACYKSLGLRTEAEACHRIIHDLELDRSSTYLHLPGRTNTGAAVGDPTVDTMGGTVSSNAQLQLSESHLPESRAHAEVTSQQAPSAMLMPRSSKHPSRHRASERRFKTQIHEERMRSLYGRTQELLERARSGDVQALVPWMAATHELVDDFRSHRGFYPCDRSLKAYERSKSSAIESLNSRVNQAMQDIIGQLDTPADDLGTDSALLVGNFRGIPLASWLDLILEYAVLLARSQKFDEAYEVVNLAKGANVFYSSVESMFLIHTCWFTCALMAHDEEAGCSVTRWFMKEFQFVTDGYRLFSAVNRLCDGKNTWFNSGPSQKYVRRQLRAMDYSLVARSQVRSTNQERASYTTKDSEGKPIYAGDMDLALLTLYGHMLYFGKSFAVALNYFFRAFAYDPTNPIINLSLALAYIQHAMKRQSDNRHQLIAQGLTFLFKYYDLRRRSRNASERQEAEFNVARTYHMLGLAHLAIPFYERCLTSNNGPQATQASIENDFAAEAAFALRNIWAANEEMNKASDVSRRYLFV
ncbi:MAG: hypothetical protein LQ344_007618 [Seirophora lacunosa]|nr:MAG: hypothetical protein LQ344_007618 [Seirophora lacunosa]